MSEPSARIGEVERSTKETQIAIRIELNGHGHFEGSTGIPFFDHMLEQIARHGHLSLKVECKGDLQIDSHHTVEDVGICLGQALAKAVGDKRGINRYGDARVPMEEALCETVLDFCGRAFLHFDAPLSRERIGSFDVEVTEDFFRALSSNAGITLHIRVPYGRNEHHIVEGIFKSFARALMQSVTIHATRKDELPSTKGAL